MSIYAQLREQIDLRCAAGGYGAVINRSGFMLCIFHDEKTPSMKLYPDHFYCFGCGKYGDITDFVMQVFGFSKHEALEMLKNNFNLTNEKQPFLKIQQNSSKSEENRIYQFLQDYRKELIEYRTIYAPKTHEDKLHPLFIESLQNLDRIEYYCDIFIEGSDNDHAKFIESHRKEIGYIEQQNKTSHLSKLAV